MNQEEELKNMLLSLVTCILDVIMRVFIVMPRLQPSRNTKILLILNQDQITEIFCKKKL